MQRASIVISAIAAVVVSAAVAVSAFAATKTVAVKDDVFAPTSISVRKGTTVKWVWNGKAPHNVTVTSGPTKFHSPTQKKGSYSKKLTKKGTYKLVCTIHAPRMAMTVKVR
jgi:plastocyanin